MRTLPASERDLLDRHHSLRAVFDYSMEANEHGGTRCTDATRYFRGGFTREAAQTVTGRTLQILLSLVNKSRVKS